MRLTRWLPLALVLVTAGCGALKVREKPAIPPEARVIHAVRAKKPPTIDGKLNDACWQTLQPVTDFRVINSEATASRQAA